MKTESKYLSNKSRVESVLNSLLVVAMVSAVVWGAIGTTVISTITVA
jgi:hypothetical protein